MKKLTSFGGEKYLFPLEKVRGWWTGYYVDEAGVVYSTKINKTVPQRLWGESVKIAGMSYTGKELLRQAKNQPSWKAEMQAPKPATPPACPKADCPTKVAKGKYELVGADAGPKTSFVNGKMKKLTFSGFTEVRATFDDSRDHCRLRLGLGDVESQSSLNSQYLDAKAIDQLIELLTFARTKNTK